MRAMNSESPKIIACPTCKKKIPYSSTNPFRPFCSERCKLIDLGAWADEQYRVPLQQTSMTDEFHEDSVPKTNDDEEDSY